MKVAFVYPEQEALGIQYLSSFLKQKGHETRLFFDPRLFDDSNIATRKRLSRAFDFRERLIHEIAEYAPDIIGFSVLSSNYEWAINFSKAVKSKVDIPVVFGGIHPTSVPEEVIRNESVDYVIVGEGEYAFSELLDSRFDAILLPSIQNLCFKRDGQIVVNSLREPVRDLNQLPFPDKDMFYKVAPFFQNAYCLMTARGCPYTCTYCCTAFLNKMYKGKYLRRRSPENVIIELQNAKKRYNIKTVYFDDGTFTYDKKWIRSFANEYKEKIGLPFFCWVHPATVDEEMVKILKFMGCGAVELGVESLIPDVRENIFRRFYTNSDVAAAIMLLKKYRITVIVENIKGFSDDVEKEIKEIVKFYNANRPDRIHVFERRFFPKTEIVGLLLSDASSDKWVLPFTRTTAVTTKTVQQLEVLLVLIFLLPRFIVDFLLARGWYKYFPPSSSYMLLEVFPLLINMFKIKKYRAWFPNRGTWMKYFYYVFTFPTYFLKRMHLMWAPI